MAKSVREDQDALFGIFERMRTFFQRLEIYTEVSPTSEMMDTMIQIMVVTLSILGIATKEMKQNRISECRNSRTSVSLLTERCSEKYSKKLIGRTNLEDALNRLDKLTNEQAQRATAEVQRATDAIDESHETVGEVMEQVIAVDDRVVNVNDETAEVIDGAQIIINLAGETLNLNHLDGKEVKRSSSPTVLSTAPLSPQPLSPNEREQSDLSSTEQATSSTSHVQLIVNALADYAKATGIDLSKNSFATAPEQSSTPETILQLLGGREKAFKEYRDGNRRLISCLSPAVNVIQAFSGVLGEASSLVSVI